MRTEILQSNSEVQQSPTLSNDFVANTKGAPVPLPSQTVAHAVDAGIPNGCPPPSHDSICPLPSRKSLAKYRFLECGDVAEIEPTTINLAACDATLLTPSAFAAESTLSVKKRKLKIGSLKKWEQISPLMWKVIGKTDDAAQARQNFALFAFFQTLRGTDSYLHWRKILRLDLFHIKNANRLAKLTKSLRKEESKKARSDDRFASAVKAALFDSYYSPQATAESISGGRSLGREPCWTGETRPFGYRRVALHSNFPSPAYLTRLVKDYGYDGHAAYAALSHAHTPWLKESDRRQNSCDSMDGEDYNSRGIAGRVPQWQASPTVHTTFGGGTKAKDVVEIISRHNWDERHQSAVFEIVYMRRKPFLVAKSLGLKLTAVYQYCSRIRAELGMPETPDLHVKSFKSFIFSRGV